MSVKAIIVAKNAVPPSLVDPFMKCDNPTPMDSTAVIIVNGSGISPLKVHVKVSSSSV